MLVNPLAALQLPLRALVWEDASALVRGSRRRDRPESAHRSGVSLRARRWAALLS